MPDLLILLLKKLNTCFVRSSFAHKPVLYGLLGLVLTGLLGCQTASTRESETTPMSPKPLIQSDSDERAYRSVMLDNKLQVLLVSDPQSDKAAAAMDVAVGSGSDPIGREGLAHFLEHMLFLGTEKYPKAGEYQAFINAHGGGHNAFTAYDHTNYFFEVDADSLEPALDRFSQQFVAPLFSPEYVEREINAVHSEYTAKYKDDGRRFFSVLKEAMNPEHPMAKFSVGTLETLADHPDQGIRDDLLAFYESHYSSHVMKLVVYGKEPLDTLETWVRERFSDVPYRPEATGQLSPDLSVFNPEDLPQLITTTPIKEKRSLNLFFPVPATKPEYETKPLYYLSNLIGHEGEGSLLSWLKSQQLADGLSAGLFSSDDKAAIFSISIQLSPKGLEEWERVVDDTMSYIALLQSRPLDAWRYAEQQKMLDIAFRFQDKSAPIHYTSSLASRLKDFPVEEVLVAPYMMERFEPETIQRFLDALQPETLTVILQAPGVPTDQQDPWYQADYAKGPLNLERLAVAGSDSPELFLPPENPFIPDDLSLLSGESANQPVLLPQVTGIKAWYAKDLSFDAPKSSFYLSLRSPEANSSARSLVLTELYVSMAREQLTEFAYPAMLAGLDFRLYKHQRGMTLRIDGFSEKQAVLLDEILATLTQLDYDPVLFERLHADLGRDLRNSLKNKPFERLATLARQMLVNPHWNEAEQMAALENLSLEDLKTFTPTLFEGINLVTLSIGNSSEEQVVEANRVVGERLLGEQGMNPPVEKPRIRRLPEGISAFESTSHHADSAYLYLVQGESKRYADRARMGLISQIISPLYYTRIRTEAQMGYVVFATPFTLLEVPSLAFIVQSPSTAPEQIHTATETFIKDFRDVLEGLTDEEFEKQQRALISRLTEEDKTLEQRADRWWTEIDVRNTDFDTMERVAKEVEGLTKEALLASYDALFLENARGLLLTSVPEERAGTWLPEGAQALTLPLESPEDSDLFPAKSSALLD